MDAQQHWDHVYQTKAPDQVSWFRPHLETSISLIESSTHDRAAHIIDVGGGESTLIDDLLAHGYTTLTVLDISPTAIEVTKKRLGNLSERVSWVVADITAANLPARAYDVWHDRAVFHFLTQLDDRRAYIRLVRHSVKPGGRVIVSTFGPDGPIKCSGLDVQRYDADSLHGEFGTRFRLIESRHEVHRTPFGTRQQFIYCFCALE